MTNDNDTEMRGSLPLLDGAEGSAALLLVESLIHALCENGTLSTAQAIELTERTASVQFDRAEAADGAGVPMWQAHSLLIAIAASLRTDCAPEPESPRFET